MTAVQLSNGSYAVVVSESRNGDVFTSALIDGPWTYLGEISVNQGTFHSLGNPGDPQSLQGPNPPPWHGSNVSLIVRPDGRFEIVQRSGQILISRDISSALTTWRAIASTADCPACHRTIWIGWKIR